MAADTSTQIDPAREPWAALVRLLNAVSNEASEAGDEAASDRAIAFRKHVASVRDRWFAGEPGPTRTVRAKEPA